MVMVRVFPLSGSYHATPSILSCHFPRKHSPSSSPSEDLGTSEKADFIGRMGQLGKIHYINTKAFLEAARHVMIEYGEYTDAEVDVLCTCLLTVPATLDNHERSS
jgi:hypothetical protein